MKSIFVCLTLIAFATVVAGTCDYTVIVVNAFDASPISGVTATSTAFTTATSDSTGTLAFSVADGLTFSVAASGSGFTDITLDLVCPAGGAVYEMVVALSPPAGFGGCRFVLTWGSTPSDLDSHMNLDMPPWGSDHVYYGSSSSSATGADSSLVNLDVDDTNGEGPETISITDLLPGTYAYFVHIYSGASGWGDSANFQLSPMVQLYCGCHASDGGSEYVDTFWAPTEGTDSYWHVADLILDETATTQCPYGQLTLNPYNVGVADLETTGTIGTPSSVCCLDQSIIQLPGCHVSVTVTDATTGLAITGTNLPTGILSDASSGVASSANFVYDASSYSLIADVDTGSYTISVEALGYTGVSDRALVCPGGADITLSIALSQSLPTAAECRVIQTWGESPSDMDSYMVMSDSNWLNEVVYYGNAVSVNAVTGTTVSLDVDDTSSFGPETIHISEMGADDYAYYSNIYSSGDWGTIDPLPLVELYCGCYTGEFVGYWDSPSTGTLDWWHVMSLRLAEGTSACPGGVLYLDDYDNAVSGYSDTTDPIIDSTQICCLARVPRACSTDLDCLGDDVCDDTSMCAGLESGAGALRPYVFIVLFVVVAAVAVDL